MTVTYDSQHLGNIASKSDVGSYAYTSSRPHAVTGAGGATYTYDANGNNLSGDGWTLQYTTFDKPYEITKGDHKTSFAYGPRLNLMHSSMHTSMPVSLGSIYRKLLSFWCSQREQAMCMRSTTLASCCKQALGSRRMKRRRYHY